MSLRLRLLIAAHRFRVKPVVARAEDAATLRRFFARGARRLFRPPPYTLILRTELGPDLPALAISNRPGSHPVRLGRVILFFHGGSFVAGSPETHAAMLSRLSRLTRIEVMAPDWPLAPEHPFPAGPEAAHQAFGALLARGYRAENIVLGGDSAGGNIALGLLARLLGEGVRPAGLFAFSPSIDLTFSGASIRENAARDPALPLSQSPKVDRFYLQGADPADPRASPLFADYPDPPPVFLQFAENEILRDDSLRLAAKLRAAGGAVTLDRWPDAPHAFVLFERWAPEAREALRRTADFVSGLFAAQATARGGTNR